MRRFSVDLMPPLPAAWRVTPRLVAISVQDIPRSRAIFTVLYSFRLRLYSFRLSFSLIS